MGATILRQWHVLTMVPRPPRRIDTASIEMRLRERGIEVHRRTIQRDLLELAEVFPLVADERARPYGWRWSDEVDGSFALPTPPPARALDIEVVLRVRKAILGLVPGRLRARRVSVSDDTRDPLFAIVLATLEDSALTRRMLLGHGDEIEVLSPLNLRREIAERAGRVLAAHAR